MYLAVQEEGREDELGVVEGFFEHFKVVGARDFLGSEAGEVVGVGLAINPGEPVVKEMAGEGREGAFAGIWDACKHGFAEKAVANSDAIEAANKLPLLPRFKGVGEPESIELAVTFDEIICNPSAGLVWAWD